MGGQCLVWPTAESWYTKGKAHTTEGASRHKYIQYTDGRLGVVHGCVCVWVHECVLCVCVCGLCVVCVVYVVCVVCVCVCVVCV